MFPLAPVLSLVSAPVSAGSAAAQARYISLGKYHDNTALKKKARTWQSPNLESEGRKWIINCFMSRLDKELKLFYVH